MTIAGIDRLQARFNANALSGRVEAGRRYELFGAGVTPFAAGQFTTLFLPAYNEHATHGNGSFALAYAGKDLTASRSEFGVRVDRSYAYGDAAVTLHGQGAWAHNFATDRSALATFQTMPQAGFLVYGANAGTDSALLAASAEVGWHSGFSLGARIDGDWSTTSRSITGKGVARFAW